MKTLEEVRQIKQQCEQSLMNQPGVTGVGVGYQTVDGQKTTTPVIIVYVSSRAAVGEGLPNSIDGVPVEISEASFIPHGE